MELKDLNTERRLIKIMEIKKSSLYVLGIVAVLIIAGFFFIRGSSISGNVVSEGGQVLEGQTQRIMLSQDGYNYQEAVARAGMPIALSADSSVGGCLRSVVFNNLEGKKYSKYLKTPDDALALPALEKGTYTFSCSMGMGLGKLIVR